MLNELILGQKTIESEFDRINKSKMISDLERIGIPFGDRTYFGDD